MVGHLESGREGLKCKNQGKLSKIQGPYLTLHLCEYLPDSAHIETAWSPKWTRYPPAMIWHRNTTEHG